MPWTFVDEKEPPKNTDILVWNGEHEAIARYDNRGRFIAHSEGLPVRDPWEAAVCVKRVTHWTRLPRAPA
jgi:hypothetical protein